MKFKCRNCQKILKIRKEMAGKKGKCPGCGAKFIIPQPKTDATNAGSAPVHASLHARSEQEAKRKKALQMPRHTQKDNPAPEPPQKPPSVAVGYIIATVVIIPLAIILLTCTVKARGGTVNIPTWVSFAIVVTFMSIGQAVNRYRRLRTPNNTAIRPVVKASEEDASQPAPDRECLTPSDSRIAGQWEEQRFVVGEHEIAAVIENPDGFDNVLVGREPTVINPLQVQNPNKMPRWFLVLAEGQAVAFNESQSQVWSVHACHVTFIPGQGILVQSNDGRSQHVGFNLACIRAWQAKTWEEFETPLNRMSPAISGPDALLRWAMEMGKDPAAWLNFELPYSSPQEGLHQLCEAPDALEALINAAGAEQAVKWLKYATDDDAEAIRSIIVEKKLAQSKRQLTTGIVLTVIGLTFPLWLYSVINTGRKDDWEAAVIISGCFFLLFCGGGIGTILHARYFQRKAEALPCDTSTKEGSK